MTNNISLKDFLKTYTAISNKFIDEYYKFYEICETNKFGIEASKVIKYLKLNSSKYFYERLRTRFILNQDYIIKRLKQKSTDNIQDTFYYLSFDGFEKVCMTSKSEKGNVVRDYFITLRKFIEYYRQHFADNINKMVKGKKCIYIILANKNKNIFKVGRSKDIRKRLYSYATGKDKHPDIMFIMLIDDPKKVEDCTKVFTKKNIVRGKQELYKIDFDTLKSIIFNCAFLTKQFNEIISINKDFDSYIVYDEGTNEYLDENNNIIGFEKIVKKTSKKSE
jgi:phage anti-repressor protein